LHRNYVRVAPENERAAVATVRGVVASTGVYGEFGANAL